MLALTPWLTGWFGLPRPLLLVMGCANLAYAGYSYTLARRPVRPPARLVLLVAANATWAVACAVAAVLTAPRATVFGTAHLALEGLFVGGLALLEWRARHRLARAHA